jgi:hypothetical protein
VRRGDEDRRLVEDRSAARRVARAPHVHAIEQRPRDVRARGQRLRAQEQEPPVGKLAERVKCGAEQRPLGLAPLEHDQPFLPHRFEQRRVDALRDDPVVAGEARLRRGRHLLRRREQRVDPAEQLLALRAARRIREPLGGEERRHGQALGLAQRKVREARQSRLETVDDVEATGAQRAREVRSHAQRHAHAAAP